MRGGRHWYNFNMGREFGYNPERDEHFVDPEIVGLSFIAVEKIYQGDFELGLEELRERKKEELGGLRVKPFGSVSNTLGNIEEAMMDLRAAAESTKSERWKGIYESRITELQNFLGEVYKEDIA